MIAMMARFRAVLNELGWRVRLWIAAKVLDRWRIRIWREGRLTLNEGHGHILNDLRTKGYCRIPAYYSEEELSAIDQACSVALRSSEGKPETLDLTRKPGAIRLRRLDEKFPLLQKIISRDAYILLIAWIFHGRPIWPSLTYQITHDGSLEDPAVPGKAEATFGGRFHFDQWFHQIKALILLSDIAPENGPLTFLAGSSSIHWPKFHVYLKKFRTAKGLKKEENYDDYLDEAYAKAIAPRYSLEQATGKRGDLYFFDTRTVHIASRLEKGSRRVLWCYF